MRSLRFGLVALAFVAGCHARYKKNADTLGRVRVQVRAQGGPVVVSSEPDAVLETVAGNADAGSVLEAGIETATVLLGAKAQRKLSKGVTPHETRAALAAGVLSDAQDQSLPYAVGKNGRSRMLIVIQDYGIDTSLGTPTAFLSTSTSIFNKQGRPVYRATETCTRTLGKGMQIEFGDLAELAAMQRVADMSPAQLDAILTKLTRACASEIARELADHLR